MGTADYVIVAGYFVVMLGIGVFFSGRMHTLRDFFGGGSEVPWWVSGVSLYMTSFSAFSFVSYSAMAYKEGFVAITIWWLTAGCAMISAVFFAARWRRAAITSPVAFVERRYSGALRQCFAWSGVPLLVIDDALKLYVIGTMVCEVLQLGGTNALAASIIVCGAIMLVYTFLGGLWAVMITDFVQFVVMGVAVLVLLPLVLIRVGGAGALIEGLPAEMWRPVSPNYPWTWVLPFFMVMTFSYSVKWPLVQRYYAVKTDSDARKVGYLVAALTVISMPLIFLPAMAARLFLVDIAPNSVYATLCRDLLPVGMVGMVVAAMFSATMSTLSGDYNAAAAVITKDIYQRLFARHESSRYPVLVGRLATLLVGLLAMGIALVLVGYPGERRLVDIMAGVFSVLLPPVALPMMFGLLTRRVSNAGALGGFLAGAAFGITAYALSFLPEFAYLASQAYMPWITTTPTLTVMVLLSHLAPDGAQARVRIDQFLGGMKGKGESDVSGVREGEEFSRGLGAVALEVIGWASGAMGALMAVAVVLTCNVNAGWLSLITGTLLAGAGLLAVVASRRLRGPRIT